MNNQLSCVPNFKDSCGARVKAAPSDTVRVAGTSSSKHFGRDKVVRASRGQCSDLATPLLSPI